ncbi:MULTISPECIES: hypothetical protein [Paraburkholderia]|uniref:Uncharacterized protein n=1 Tax=Paraburkholderia ferrariae TaxID=386056 RepID=A0ABU9RV58_9BURK
MMPLSGFAAIGRNEWQGWHRDQPSICLAAGMLLHLTQPRSGSLLSTYDPRRNGLLSTRTRVRNA